MIENGITSLTNDWVEKKKKKKQWTVLGNFLLTYKQAMSIYKSLRF
jgi:hypothetical protein